jgi:hypothetical protein
MNHHHGMTKKNNTYLQCLYCTQLMYKTWFSISLFNNLYADTNCSTSTKYGTQLYSTKKVNLFFTKIILLVIFCFLCQCTQAQKGASYLRLRVPVQYARYKVNVTSGTAELRGEKKNHSINAGAGVAYEYFLKDRLSVESGIGISTVSYRIVRPFDRRFWGDLQRPVRVTYPKYSYSLLQLPVRINYRISADKRLKCFIGLSDNLGFTFRQSYADDSRLNKFYLFSNTVELNARLQFSAGRKIFLAIEPNVQLYNQWKKDLVLSEYGIDVFEKPNNQPHYNKQFFDAVGITFSAAYNF